MARDRRYVLVALRHREQPSFTSDMYGCSHEELQPIIEGLRNVHPHILVPFRLSLLLNRPTQIENLPGLNEGCFSSCAERWLQRFLEPATIIRLLQEKNQLTMNGSLETNNPIFKQLVDWWKRDLHVLALFTSAQQEDFTCD